MEIAERFINYTKFDTQSVDESETVPSNPKQLIFARYLKEELEKEGLKEVEMDEKGYIYATLPANTDKSVPTIGFIAHYDTALDASGANIKARIVKSYDGGDIELSPGIVSSPKMFPELLAHKGEDLIVTDGTTLLGADDKAGIAEIVQAMCWLRDHPEVKHGKIRVGFNPDEEIGKGAHHFDVEKFGCEWAYTMDGGDIGELEYECFNAAAAKIIIHGVSVHTGYAKGKMINAARLAAEFNALIPTTDIPETTEGYEGFYHLEGVSATVDHATARYIVRDHDAAKFQQKLELMDAAAALLNQRLGEERVTVEIKQQYRNMAEIVRDYPELIDVAKEAYLACGVEPQVLPIRGGTDGAQLSFRGLPCPNLSTGGYCYHGVNEFVPVSSLVKMTDVLQELVARFA